MKILVIVSRAILFFVFLSCSASGQLLSEDTRGNGVLSLIPQIVGELSTGIAAAAPEKDSIPPMALMDTVVRRGAKFDLTIKKVSPVSHRLPDIIQRQAAGKQSGKGLIQQPFIPLRSYVVYARRVDGEKTFVEWWSTSGGPIYYTAVSNVDWKYLSGFHSLEHLGTRFDFILFRGSISLSDLEGSDVVAGERYRTASTLPNLVGGARYQLVGGDHNDPSALAFMDALHELYDDQKERLHQTFVIREQNHRLRRLAEQNTPKSIPKAIINYSKAPSRQRKSFKK